MRTLIVAIMIISIAVIACDDDDPAPQAPTASPTFPSAPVTPIVPETSVFLFSIGAVSSAEALDVGGVAFVEWLEDGKSVVGFDWKERAHKLIDVDSAMVVVRFAFGTEGSNMRTVTAHPVPGGRFIFISRDDGTGTVYDVAANDERPFAGPPGENGGFEPSPDGTSVAFNNVAEGRTTVMISNIDGSAARVLRRNRGGSVSAVWHTWSPDGSWLLMHEFPPEDCGQNCFRMGSYIVTDANGEAVWRLTVATDESLDLRWAGRNRLLLWQANPSHRLPETPRSSFIDIPSGAETAAPPDLALQFVSMSPDGRHAIMRLGDKAAAWEQRCSLVEIDPALGTITELVSKQPAASDFQTVFCTTVDWTADGTQAIVSAGGT